jgi:predicted nucleic acid-binding protein
MILSSIDADSNARAKESPSPCTPAAKGRGRSAVRSRQTLHAPHLLDLEVAQVIRRYATKGEIDSERARMALPDLADLPLP